MQRISTVQVIDSLAEITRYHDREVLEKSLVTTLSEMVPTKQFRLYRVLSTEPDINLGLLAYANHGAVVSDPTPKQHRIPEQLARGIVHAIQGHDLVDVEDERRGLTDIVYPVFDRNNEIYAVLVQVADHPQLSDQRLVHGMVRIYSNYLALIEESQKDKLTNLLNRETLDREITKLIVAWSQKQHRLSGGTAFKRSEDGQKNWLCIVDVDHFKHINDEYGHLYGDEVLILLARLFEQVFRDEDRIFRYGGEEFVVILKTPSRKGTEIACERLRATVAEFAFPQVGHITISIGVVEITDQEGTAGVIDQADKSLYYAKEHGRNQVRFFEDLVAQGLLEDHVGEKAGEVDFF